MSVLAFAGRNLKEIARDPSAFLILMALPVGLLLMLGTIGRNTGLSDFEIEALAPGLAVFSLAFVALFGGTLLAGDRASSFLTRVLASPLSTTGLLVAYALPLVALGLAQGVVCFVAAMFMGLELTANLLLALVVLAPSAVMFVGIGLLLGSALSSSQVGAAASGLITFATFVGGYWMDLAVLGDGFAAVARMLPFVHAADAARAAVTGDFGSIGGSLLWCAGYAIAVFALSVVVFRRRSRAG
ncbi:ABC transporter permease [Cellulomonas timonensis]|uniref:ABC transporter permease n=1 Tax=Cellulomonas timonensis TaxID=1689271 RepID=UPI0008306545|nr:ABC transporter permease [Cellulomonas timonensis]